MISNEEIKLLRYKLLYVTLRLSTMNKTHSIENTDHLVYEQNKKRKKPKDYTMEVILLP